MIPHTVSRKKLYCISCSLNANGVEKLKRKVVPMFDLSMNIFISKDESLSPPKCHLPMIPHTVSRKKLYCISCFLNASGVEKWKCEVVPMFDLHMNIFPKMNRHHHHQSANSQWYHIQYQEKSFIVSHVP